MPIYEYQCETCGNDFEKLVRVGAEAPPCPECGAEHPRKKISAAAFVLKGSGWYRDHYGLKKSAPASDSSSESSSSPSPSTSDSGPTKAAAK